MWLKSRTKELFTNELSSTPYTLWTAPANVGSGLVDVVFVRLCEVTAVLKARAVKHALAHAARVCLVLVENLKTRPANVALDTRWNFVLKNG